MRLTTIAAGAIMVLGLSTAAYAEAGKCGTAGIDKQSAKCGGSTKGNMPFSDKKAMCLAKVDTMKKCVEAAQTAEGLQACRDQMMKKGKGMQAMKGKCGTGKCGSK